MVLLAVGAVLLNLHSPTIFFENPVLLGSGLGVFALLEFGVWGLPVGCAAALTPSSLWGHSYQAVTLIPLLIWQMVALRGFRHGPAGVGNGRIVIATIAYWLLLGLPVHQLLFTTVLRVNGGTALALGLKEAVVTVATAGIALLVHLSLRLLGQPSRTRELSIRGLSFATLLTAISVPAVLIILLMGHQLTAIQLQEQTTNLRVRAEDLLYHGLVPYTTRSAGPATAILLSDGYAFEAIDRDGRRISSNPRLFARLARDFNHEPIIQEASGPPLELLVSRRIEPRLLQLLNGYWCYHLKPTAADRDDFWQEITLVQPALGRINHMMGLMRVPLLLLGSLLVLAALLAEGLAALFAEPFERVLGSLHRPRSSAGEPPPPLMPSLPITRIRELNRLVAALNDRGHAVNDLSLNLLENNRQLRLSEQRHRLLADNALDLIVLLSADGQPTYVSPSITCLRGFSQEEALALPLRRHLRPDGHRQVIAALRRMRRAQVNHQPLPFFRLELEQRHRNGSWVLTDVTATAIADEDSTCHGILVICRDMGERWRAAARRREQLEQKLRASLTAAAAGHEISQPLATLQLANRLMRQTLHEAEPERRDQELEALLQLQHEAGDAAMATIDVMRRLLREPLRPSGELDLAALAGSVLRQIRTSEAATGVLLQEQGLEEPCPIQGDASQIEVALSNLLANALQAVAQRPERQRTVRLSLSLRPAWAELRVEDSGPGLPPDLLEQLPLFSTRPGGTGLGLYLVRVMLDNHGGQLRPGRSPLGGASLSLDLPLPGPAGGTAAPGGDGDPAIAHA